MAEHPTLDEFKSMVQNFDWYYEMSDSYDVWRDRSKYHDKIMDIATQDDAYWKVYDDKINSIGLPDHVKTSWLRRAVRKVAP